MRPIPSLMLTRGFRLTVALGAVCSAAAVAGWAPIPEVALFAPSLTNSAEVAGLSSLSNGPQTSVTEATPLISHLERGDQRPDTAGLVELAEGDKAVALLAYMNAARVAEGTHELARDGALDAVAMKRAEDLLRLGYFEHYGPDGESAFSELRARDIKYRLAGENLARNNHPAERTVIEAFDSLMASEGHRANIVEQRFYRVGIAAVQSGKVWLYVTVFTN